MSLARSPDGRITFELNEAEVDAYIKAGIDRRLDAYFQHHYRTDLRGIVYDGVAKYLRDSPEGMLSMVGKALESWLAAREGWVASMLIRGHARRSRAVGEEGGC